MKTVICRTLFFVALSALLPFATAFAQQTPVNSSQSVVTLPAQSQASGTYRGDIYTTNGNDAFELELTQKEKTFQGKLQFFKSSVICRQAAPVTGILRDDGIVELDAPNVIKGCERKFTLPLQDGKFVGGDLVGPNGVWKVGLRKQ